MINGLVREAPAAFWDSLGALVCGSGPTAEDTDTELGSPTAMGTRAIRSREDTVITNTSIRVAAKGLRRWAQAEAETSYYSPHQCWHKGHTRKGTMEAGDF